MLHYSAVIPRVWACSSSSSISPSLLLLQHSSLSARRILYHSASSAAQCAGPFLPPSSVSSASLLPSSMWRQLSVEPPRFKCGIRDITRCRLHDAFPYRPCRSRLSFKALLLSNAYFDSRSSAFQGAFLRGTASSQSAAAATFHAERPALVLGPSFSEKGTIESNFSSNTAASEQCKPEHNAFFSPSTCLREGEEGCNELAGIGKVGALQSRLPLLHAEDELEEASVDHGANRMASSPSSEDAKLSGGRFSRRLGSSVRSRSERRRKGTVFARPARNEPPDLLAVPGIGPRNLEKLVAKGIGRVVELKQLYRDKFINDEGQQMVEFLQSSVGIVHRNHAESITSYVKNSVEEEQKQQSSAGKESCNVQKKVTICVEGNISVGKTTFLRKVASEIIELRDLVEIVPEPVDKWKDVGPEHFNLLDAFYNEPERYAYTFQNYVFATRLMKEQETSKGVKPLRLMERSIFSDRLVFVRAVHEAKWMSELELRIYESWFDPFISALPGLVPDGFIYLRASPDTCLQRLHLRNRPEEKSVTLEYLRGLHEKHEQCFFPSERTGGIYSVNPMPSHSHRLPPSPRIRDRIFYLEGDHLHSSIRKVPALILDCEASVDLNRDLEARVEYAQQVAEFYEYIRSNKDLAINETAPSEIINPFLLPYSGGLYKPDGYPFLHGKLLDGLCFGHRP